MPFSNNSETGESAAIDAPVNRPANESSSNVRVALPVNIEKRCFDFMGEKLTGNCYQFITRISFVCHRISVTKTRGRSRSKRIESSEEGSITRTMTTTTTRKTDLGVLIGSVKRRCYQKMR